MLFVGLTGVIGSGKSTVAAMLAARGAEIIDADRVGWQVYEPGKPAHAEIVDAFGPTVVAADGTIDRRALGPVVFSDPAKLRRLEAITHPRMWAKIDARVASFSGTKTIVVLDMAILNERRNTDCIVVVGAREDTLIRRLEARGITEEDTRRRLANQVSLEDKLKFADFVIWNDGTTEELEARVSEVWTELAKRAS